MDMIDVKIGKVETTLRVEFSKLPVAMQQGVVEYGLRQLLNDAHAAISLKDGDTPEEAKTKRAEIEGAVNKRLDALQAGTYRFGAGGGGKRITAFEAALREIVEGLLRSKGIAAADAKKAAMTPEATIREMSAKKAGETGADAAALFEKNWGAIKAKAQAIADLKQTDADL